MDGGVLIAVLGAGSAVLGIIAAWVQIRHSLSSKGEKGPPSGETKKSRPAAATIWPTTGMSDTALGEYPTVRVGRLEIEASFRLGSLLTSWPPERVNGHYDEERQPAFPPPLEARMPALLKARLADSDRAQTLAFDGPAYSIRDCRVATAGTGEATTVEILFGPTSYFEYLSTNLSVDDPLFPQSLLADLPRSSLPGLPLSNQFAVNFSVITADRHVLLQRRSQTVANFPSLLANGVNATTQRTSGDFVGDEDDRGRPDLFETVARECEEELGVMPDKGRMEMYGIVVEHRHYQPIAIGHVEVPLTVTELRNEAGAWARDKFEYDSLESIPLVASTVAESLASGEWVPVCALATLTTAMQLIGRSEMNAALQAIRERKIG